MRSLTSCEVAQLFRSRWWEQRPARMIVDLQIRQNVLCVPVLVYLDALREVLGYDVTIDEFSDRWRLQDMVENATAVTMPPRRVTVREILGREPRVVAVAP